MPTEAAAEERWRLTVENAPVGIALANLAGRFVRVNDRLCQLVGYSHEEMHRRTWQELTHADDLADDLGLTGKLLAGELSSFQLRKRYVHADGHPVWVNLVVGLVRDAEGRPEHFISHITDLTEEIEVSARIARINEELAEQKARLERSNADLEAFAMLASHDLQAPLATVRGYMELLQTEYADVLDEVATDWISRVSQATDRMSDLVNSLLEFSRVGPVGLLVREAVSVTGLVADVRQDLEQLIRDTSAVVLVEPGPAIVEAQPTRLRQVLQNLVQNTIKYRDPGRTPVCVVAVAQRESDWLVTVTDNASGIPAEAREAVFAMFTRVAGDEQGHGIGLAACRQIVERHGGRIWVDDNPDGPGSRISFTLPRHEELLAPLA